MFHRKYPINSICSYLWGIRYVRITLIEEGCAVFYFSENLKTERAEERNEKIKRGKPACGAADYNQYQNPNIHIYLISFFTILHIFYLLWSEI